MHELRRLGALLATWLGFLPPIKWHPIGHGPPLPDLNTVKQVPANCTLSLQFLCYHTWIFLWGLGCENKHHIHLSAFFSWDLQGCQSLLTVICSQHHTSPWQCQSILFSSDGWVHTGQCSLLSLIVNRKTFALDKWIDVRHSPHMGKGVPVENRALGHIWSVRWTSQSSWAPRAMWDLSDGVWPTALLFSISSCLSHGLREKICCGIKRAPCTSLEGWSQS